jgi:mxaD protein
MLKRFLLISAFLLAVTPASAHGPTPHKAEESIVIAASPSVVWEMVADFAGLAGWHPLVATCKVAAETASNAERTLTLRDGGALVESLDELDGGGRSLSYRLIKPNLDSFPVSFYSATLTVREAPNNGSMVRWSARFYRGDTGNYPPETLDDAAAQTAMINFIQAGLAGLKEKTERR